MWAELIADSFRRPRAVARRLIELDPPGSELWIAGLMVACLETVVLQLTFRLMPAELAASFGGSEMVSPLISVAEQALVLALAAVLVARVGALFGGTGTLKGAAIVVLWGSFVSAPLPLVTVAAIRVSEVLSGVIALAAAGWVIWAFASFIAELHGFRRTLPVMFGIVATWVILVLGLSMLFAIIAAPEVS